MVTENLERAYSTAREVLVNVKPDHYDASTPCQSWDVRRLLSHIIGGSQWFAESVNAGVAPDPAAAEATDFTQGDLVGAFDEASQAALAAFSAPGAQEKIVKLPFGDLPAAIFMAIATNDVFTHTWDLARATGQSTDLDPDFAAQLNEGARMMIGDDFRGPEGSGAFFGPEQQAPAGATPADIHAAFMGRKV
jgi:uncharacterized protein (TIGR03086 family)